MNVAGPRLEPLTTNKAPWAIAPLGSAEGVLFAAFCTSVIFGAVAPKVVYWRPSEPPLLDVTRSLALLPPLVCTAMIEFTAGELMGAFEGMINARNCDNVTESSSLYMVEPLAWRTAAFALPWGVSMLPSQ